ncbi:MmgE/PrpD family protein [Ancylobacter defluvii]|uniref:MmgE/PrpD family protein n=1 Tax=Ancylobacter defluvii TaxID=1282440 RepID=A0A9W6JXB1_9HYPH|nr:MmgE/PrpD family protein [Ancylobacter defluvii]MBS7586296.1 MmgE/PrpD family protein [Ancylobacter defluvii]GLK85576.1 hypothetical protein GCM10017653_36460 [Ancylobacter defluvii]
MSMQRPDTARIAETLGTFVADLPAASVPESARLSASRALVDIVGIAFAGSALPLARVVRAQTCAEARPGAALVLGAGGERLVATAAARINATAAHVLDFDANFNIGMVFAPAALYPALIAMGEETGANGAELIGAFAVGAEVIRTLAECLSEAPYRKDRDSLFYKGWFNSAVLGPIGAAAAVARLIGLDADRTAHALAIAAVQAGGLRIAVGSDMKPVLCARAGETGLRAALLARDGAEGPLDAFEGPRGLIEVINGGQWSSLPLARLGSFEAPGTSFKLYPACSSVQAAAESLEALLQRHDIEVGEVVRVRCEVTGHILRNLAFPLPANVTQAQFSMPFALGCILAHGRFTADLLTAETVADPAVHREMAKVEMVGADLFDDEEEARNGTEATRVTITTADGREVSHFQAASTGKPMRPMPDDLLDAKFRRNVAPFMSPAIASDLLARLRGIEAVDDLSRLFPAEVRGS